jgi:hypothetical protein
MGATGAQTTSAIYTAIETGANSIPVVGPIVASVARIIQAFGVGTGCGGTCTQATQIVNQIEPLMKQNLAAAQQQAQSNGGCLTSAEQQVAVQNFQTLWQQVLSGCGRIPAPGGTQCISDRQPGGKYDWTSYYLAPIQQIPVCTTGTAGPGLPTGTAGPGLPTGTAGPGLSTGTAGVAASATVSIPPAYLYLGIFAAALLLVKK